MVVLLSSQPPSSSPSNPALPSTPSSQLLLKQPPPPPQPPPQPHLSQQLSQTQPSRPFPTQIEQDILSRPRAVPCASLYATNFKLEPPSPHEAAAPPQLHFQSLLAGHPDGSQADQPTLSRRSSADSLSHSRLQLLSLTRQRSLSVSPDQEDHPADAPNHRDHPLGLELDPAHHPPLQVPALIVPPQSSLSSHRTRMRSRSISSNQSPWPIDLALSTPEHPHQDGALSALKPPSKKPIPPPLDLTQFATTSLDPATQLAPPDRPTSPSSPIESALKPSSPLIKPEQDLVIEDEERKAAEWMDTCSTLGGNPNEDHHAHPENAYHRIIVSQRLPELLEEVDISEAVEYVLPLLSGLAQDDEAIREALGPSLCNIMWYYFSKCPLVETEEPPVNDVQHRPATSSSSRADASSCSSEWPTEERRKRPQISIGSFTVSLINLLTDTNRSIGLLSRYGLLAFLCRLLDCPLPEWSEDIRLVAGEPYLPTEYHGIDREDHYEGYLFSDSIRRRIAYELVSLVIHELCQPSKPDPALLRRDRSEASESDEWDTVPLGGDEAEQSTRQGYYALDPSNPSSNLPGGSNSPSNSSSALNLPPVDNFFSRHLSSQYSSESLNPNESLDCIHRQQVGLVVIESIAQARCLDAGFMHRKLLRQVLDLTRDEDCRALRQQAASTLTTLMISLPSSLSTSTSTSPPDTFVEMDEDTENLLINAYRSFASDMDPEVRKQICLGLPALLKLVQHRPRAELSLDLIQHFSRDDNREVRIVGYQILGELIYVFHLEKSAVPKEIVHYFLSGFEPHHQSMSEALGDRMSDRMRSFGCSMDFDDPPSLMLGPFDQLNDRCQDQLPQTSSSFGTSAITVEDTERAMCCSYNFPAVLLTLGVGRWQDLRSLFLKLAMDVSYPPRIRRSLARSMHELIKLIRAPVKQTCSVVVHDSIENSTSLATEDWLRVLKFFLFEDPVISNTESVLETLETSLGDIDVEGELSSIICKLTEYFCAPDSDSLRTVGWTVRERVILLLPKLFDHLSDYFIERECDGCLKTLLFAGLNDPAAAVREAALQFVPILYNSGRNPDNRNFQLRLLSSLKRLSQDANYRVRMIYPRAIFNLVKLQLPIDVLESVVLEGSSLTEISQDRVGGVRIGLSRLVHELCTSNDYYGCESGRRIPRLLRRVIEKLSKDPESVVCSFIDDLAKVRNPDNEPLQDTEPAALAHAQRSSSTDRTVSHLGRSWDGRSNVDDSSGSVRMECLEEDSEDDLSGSGIQVDESRLSEDEGVKISIHEDHSDDDESTTPLGERQAPLQTSIDVADESFDSPNLSLSSVSTDANLGSSEEDDEEEEDRLVEQLCGLRCDDMDRYHATASSSFTSFPSPPLQSSSCLDEHPEMIEERFQNSTSDEADVPTQLGRKKGPAGVRSERSSSRRSGPIRRSVSEPVGRFLTASSFSSSPPPQPQSVWYLNPNPSSAHQLSSSGSSSSPKTSTPKNAAARSRNGSPTTPTTQSRSSRGKKASPAVNGRRSDGTNRYGAGLGSSFPLRPDHPDPDHQSAQKSTRRSTDPASSARFSFINSASNAHSSIAAADGAGAPVGEQLWMRETDGGFVEVGEY
ncbi:hypothetical protein PtA15_16A198 [Puccinia triticina]|uniref:Uncharacterized protein n=1 Tax=Puccinia triticina TaxID=208348 RepID=A0ABY7DBG5_9BASI|nr:uncharacterized protein PtA15_16A198 [Puccinia triticina]WAQ92292.1 hypothetical protein PtA15_16A198 [Puccinia triticina]